MFIHFMGKYCKYCETEIDFYDWFLYKTCFACDEEIKIRKGKKKKINKEKQKRDSKRYWDKQK